MAFWNKYWARIRTVICIAVALGVFLLPVPFAHAGMMKNNAGYDTSIAVSGVDLQHHSIGSGKHSNIVEETTKAADKHHDSQCCPAGCISVALIEVFTIVLSEQTSVQAGLTPHILPSVDVIGILRPPLA